MVMFLVPTMVFAIYAEILNGRSEFLVAVALYLVWTLVWSRASIRWMKARAEVVDVEELLRLKREQERSRRGWR
jgi:hypothetical protein